MIQSDDTADGYELIQRQRSQTAGETGAVSIQERLEADQARAVRDDQDLRERILAPARVPDGWKLISLPYAEVQWKAGNSGSSPGWIATNLPNLADGVVAFVPSYWVNGTDVDIRRVQSLWSAECVGTASLTDAADKLESLRSAAAGAPADGAFASNPPPNEGLDLQTQPAPERDSLYEGAPPEAPGEG